MKKAFVIALSVFAAGALLFALPASSVRRSDGGGTGGGVVDLGSGGVAAVFLAAEGTVPLCWEEAIAETSKTVRAISLDPRKAISGEGVPCEDLDAFLASRGVERACLVACGECCPMAVSAAKKASRLEEPRLAGLILVGAARAERDLALPAVYFTAPDPSIRGELVEKVEEILKLGAGSAPAVKPIWKPAGRRAPLRPM